MTFANKHWIEKVPANNQEMETITGERVKEHGPFRALEAIPAAPAMPRLQAGAVVKHYEFIRQLGAGGMGTVFLARDTRLGRLVAVKVLLKYTGAAAFRFLEEARTTAQCRHENIVVIYDVDEYDGYPYMVLEYIAGRTLRAAMTEHGTDAARFAVKTMLPVVRALVRAHEMGIVHRDLKPENILLAHDGSIKVLDFGIAKQISAPLLEPAEFDAFWSDENRLQQTKDGPLIGTLAYMAPEQLLGQTVDERTDIWAVGVILYEIIAGHRPIDVTSHSQMIDVMRAKENVPGIRERCPNLGHLAEIVDLCLRKNKSERFSSAKELLEALERVAGGKTNTAPAEDERPFAGLSAFQEADAARFFGRDADIAAVLTKLHHHELIAVTGPSGAGKSSFVRAGLLPALKQSGKPYETWVVRPGRRPLAALAEALSSFADGGATENAVEDFETIVEILRTQPGYLGSKLRARCRKRGADQRIVLFVDQFEELYTLGADAAEHAAFCACLEGVADDAASPLRVIVTMRADFLERLTENRHLLAVVTRGLVFLPPMGPDGLRDALVKPLELVHYAFEDAKLVDEMLAGLSGTKNPLPILQFTMTKWWDARDRERRILTRGAYQRLGGVAGALSTHADAVLMSLPSTEQRLVRAIFLRLVTVERTRAIVRVDELRSLFDESAVVDEVLAHLADARLLSIEVGDDGEEKNVELTHESLVERWGKLRSWLDTNDQHAQFLTELRNVAQQWEKNGEAEGLLWRDDAALHAGQWLTRSRMNHGADGTIDIGKREHRYLEAVVRLAERTQRRRRQFVAIVVTAIAAVAVVVSVLALRAREQARRADNQARRADERANEAEEGARRARNATRMAAARGLEQDPTTMLAVLREMETGLLLPRWDELVRWARGAGVAETVIHGEEKITDLAWSPDGHLGVVDSDMRARVWNLDFTNSPREFRGHNASIRGIAWSADGRRIATASLDKTVRVQNADGTGEPMVLSFATPAFDVAWSPNGKRLAIALGDEPLQVWNSDGTGKPLVFRDNALVTEIKFNPNGASIVSIASDNVVRIWNTEGMTAPLVLDTHVNDVAISPDGRYIATASADNTVRVWNNHGTGNPRILQGHENVVTAVAFTADGQRIVSGSADRTIRIWNVNGASRPTILHGHGDKITVLSVGSDGRMVSYSYDMTLRIWQLDTTDRPRFLSGHEGAIGWTSYSPDGRHILSASLDKTVRMWKADGSGQPTVFQGHTDAVNAASYSADGRRFVTASNDKTVRIWNIDGHSDPIVLRGHTAAVNSAVFSPDGRRVVSASHDNTVRVWNADGSGEPLVLRGHEHIVYGAAFSPDGRQIVSTSQDKTVRIWNADGRGEPIVLRGHTGGVIGGAAYSSDGKHIVSGSRDKTLRIWNADGTGEPVVLRGHDALVLVHGDKPFSADGKRVVSSSDDGTVRIWNVDGTGDPIVLRLSDKPIDTASFSPDGRSIVAAGDDQTITIVTDLDPYLSAADPRLWTVTSYCMPLEVRKTLLGFSDEQSRADLDRCRQNVKKARHVAATAN